MIGRTTTEWDVCVCVVGVGVVGESLLRQFATAFDAIGFDVSEKRIQALAPSFETSKNVQLTTKALAIARATHFFISVPTPLRADNSVNLDFIDAAVRTVIKHAAPGCCITIESSIPVGTTRKILGPYKDQFYCGMSPERIDPGRPYPAASKIPKVVSALTSLALTEIVSVYSMVFETIVPVSRPEVAEMTKLFENCYRMVNIAYVNEISDACESHGIDPHEMIGAASTKPFGFQPFYPGIGVGGFCIPINPFYLFTNNPDLPVLERATKLMWHRPRKLAMQFYDRCHSRLAPKGQRGQKLLPRVLLVGIGFKSGQSDLSASPSLAFAQMLKERGCETLSFYDPLVQEEEVQGMEKVHDSCWDASYIDATFDGVAICHRHETVDFAILESVRKTFVHSFVGLGD
jgi:nucleotide sugar dehydrogenase